MHWINFDNAIIWSIIWLAASLLDMDKIVNGCDIKTKNEQALIAYFIDCMKNEHQIKTRFKVATW